MDLLAFDDLDLFAAETTDPLVMLDQDLYHRMIEAPGSNPDDPDRGLGIEDALSGPVDPGLGARIEAEFKKDPRVSQARATITQISGTGNAGAGFRIEIEVVADGGALAMDLTLDAAGLVRTP